jgi:diacylglycerol kinase (ATP)
VTSEITLFANPAAGRGRGARAAAEAGAALRAAGFPVRTVVGRDAADALALAHAAVAAGTGALVVAGGDGMVALALQAVAGTGTPLGVVATGTGNDFARAAGLPVGDPVAAARLAAAALAAGRTEALDLGRVSAAGPEPVSGRWFGTVLASGLDSRVNDRANRMRHPAGRLRYDLALLAELAALRPIPYRLRLGDGPVTELEATLVAVGNGPSYGGGMRICPGAALDDGLLEVCVVGPCSRRTLLRVFPRVYRGTHTGHPVVAIHRAARVELAAEAVTGYADGERVGPLPVTVEAVRGAVRLLR